MVLTLQQAVELGLGHPDHAAGEYQVLGPGDPDERRQTGRPDRHTETGARPGQRIPPGPREQLTEVPVGPPSVGHRDLASEW